VKISGRSSERLVYEPIYEMYPDIVFDTKTKNNILTYRTMHSWKAKENVWS
jgi:hypothetical protein